MNARYDLVPGATAEEQANGISRRRTTLKSGLGLYYQPPQYQETLPVFGTPNLLSNRSVQYSLGVEQELSRQVDLSVEGFFKDLSRQVSRAADRDLVAQAMSNLMDNAVKFSRERAVCRM